MKKVAIILIIIVGLTGLLFYFGREKAVAPLNNQPTVTNDNTSRAIEEKSENQVTSAGAYINYSKESIEATTGTKILFFHAPWCPQCRALDTSIKESSIPQGVTLVKVDYDTNQELRQKYGVTIQTTLVLVDDQGNLVKKYVAYEQPTFEAVKANLL